jgi:hypothetical protein
VAGPRTQETLEQRQQRTENARRSARFKYAQDRIRRITGAAPPFTDEQLAKLVVLLQGGSGAEG